jgi:biofilm PGA synthesis N-glycosyltransferase PgaC
MHTALSVIFWLSLFGILYTYLGYPLLITLIARWRSKPVRSADITPSVTMLVAAYNEEDCIAIKIENTLALDYPLDRLDLLVVTDGSTDRTNEIVASYAGRGVRLLYAPQRGGKVGALLRGFPQVRGEIVVFSDANAFFQRDTLLKLVRHFADPEVAGASGAKRMLREGESAAGQGALLALRILP